jgi:hypothetical protein
VMGGPALPTPARGRRPRTREGPPRRGRRFRASKRSARRSQLRTRRPGRRDPLRRTREAALAAAPWPSRPAQGAIASSTRRSRRQAGRAGREDGRLGR